MASPRASRAFRSCCKALFGTLLTSEAWRVGVSIQKSLMAADQEKVGIETEYRRNSGPVAMSHAPK